MKANLVVSNCTELWIDDAKKYQFLTENCRDYAIAHGLPSEQCLAAPRYMFNTHDSINFINDCLARLLPVIARRLARHYGYQYSFWNRILFLYLRDLIGGAYTIFEQIEAAFDPAMHELHIASLPEKSPMYGVSGTLEDALYWGITDEGREYYAGEYFRLFYPDMFSEYPIRKRGFAATSNKETSPIIGAAKGIAKGIIARGGKYLRVMVTNAQHEKSSQKKFICAASAEHLFIIRFHLSMVFLMKSMTLILCFEGTLLLH